MCFKNNRAALGRPSFIEVEENVRLHLIDLGEGDPVVLLHGWPFSNSMFEYQYQYLVKAGYRVIGISLRGFGLSDKPYGQYNYDVFADDLKIVLEMLEIKNAILGGFSMGAGVAIRYTAKYHGAHISKLALFGAATPFFESDIDPTFGFSKENIDALIRLSQSNRAELLRIFARLFADGNAFIAANMVQWFDTIYSHASSYAMEQCLMLMRDADLLYDLKALRIYTAIFHGKNDKVFSFDLSEQLYSLLPRSYFVPFEHSGHALFLEEMEKFNSSFLSFIQFANVKVAPERLLAEQ